jgi:hypothetical protein
MLLVVQNDEEIKGGFRLNHSFTTQSRVLSLGLWSKQFSIPNLCGRSTDLTTFHFVDFSKPAS